MLSALDPNLIREKMIRLWHRHVIARRLLHGNYVEREGVNLGSAGDRLPGFWNIDINIGAEIVLDLSRGSLPFPDNSMRYVVCMSAINYFTRERGAELVKEVYRILKPGGVARFGVQDLRIIARRYVEGDRDFFFQKTEDGRERFEGQTMGDKVNSWFYGYMTPGGPGRYVYDFDSLAVLFKSAGFEIVEERKAGESRVSVLGKSDNRAEQMFFLEAVKQGGGYT